MKTSHYALYQLQPNAHGVIVDQHGVPFDRDAYSRFKYGWLPPAEWYARGLTKALSYLRHESQITEVRVVSAPYKALPTASHAIAEYLVEGLVACGRPDTKLLPMHKAKMGSSTYAMSSPEVRAARTKAMELSIDEEEVTDNIIIVVDDIRITGAAERKTAEFIEALNPAEVLYVHAAIMDPEFAASHPGIENELNQSHAHSLGKMVGMMWAGSFQLNTRVMRWMLENAALPDFLAVMPRNVVQLMHDSAQLSGSDYQKLHARNLAFVAKALDKEECSV